ncbi:MAG: hypothetical protein KC589_02065 [Nanoarchaeota archaeon]|nr:hypothetical protein [Nanoarchaeota archaeon]
MFKKITAILSSFAYTKYERIQNYIDNLEKHIKIESRTDQSHIDEIKLLIDDRIKRLKRLYIISFIFYIGIYFSFFSLLFANTIILSEIANLINILVSFVGTTAFIIGIFFVNKLREIYYQDLNLLSAHLISIFNDQKKRDAPLFPDSNGYNQFISFFKRRGF